MIHPPCRGHAPDADANPTCSQGPAPLERGTSVRGAHVHTARGQKHARKGGRPMMCAFSCPSMHRSRRCASLSCSWQDQYSTKGAFICKSGHLTHEGAGSSSSSPQRSRPGLICPSVNAGVLLPPPTAPLHQLHKTQVYKRQRGGISVRPRHCRGPWHKCVMLAKPRRKQSPTVHIAKGRAWSLPEASEHDHSTEIINVHAHVQNHTTNAMCCVVLCCVVLCCVVLCCVVLCCVVLCCVVLCCVVLCCVVLCCVVLCCVVLWHRV